MSDFADLPLWPNTVDAFYADRACSDPVAPYPLSAQLFADAPAPKLFVTLEGAPHIRFGPPWESVAIRSQIDFFDCFLEHRASGEQRLRRDANVPGVASLQAAAVGCARGSGA
jgi:hypothetical protein